ncbi:hypothetical protein TNCV_1665601 [Trichonephila clavipes]|nr:hypothetical protein TNCV_1665601 [Trichonephila clavipes]
MATDLITELQSCDKNGIRAGIALSKLPHPVQSAFRGCGSPVVKVSDHGRHVMSSSPLPLKTRRVGQRCTLNLSRAQTSSRCDTYSVIDEYTRHRSIAVARIFTRSRTGTPQLTG